MVNVPENISTQPARRAFAIALAVEHCQPDPGASASRVFALTEVIEEYLRTGKVPDFPTADPKDSPPTPRPTLQSVPVRDIPPG